MASVHELLNQVWSLFRQIGIADDLAIIEHIAALLLEKNGLELPDFKLRATLSDWENTEQIMQQLLEEAANPAGGAATLLDRHVLFRLPTMLPGGRYPTPRHIVGSMLYLAEVKATHRLGDFACGSGGFLVHRPKNSEEATATQTIGVEISPEWAELARINARLHGVTSPRIETGNALQVCAPDGPLAGETFDRILMNPPFGEKIDAGLAERALRQKVGSRSETALTALALSKLAIGGRAAILVPLGLLFSNSTGERELRRRLVDEYELEAVVSFPKDAFQPFSTLQTHLLLARNTTPTEQGCTWFLQTEYDGYPSGRGRDLTMPPTGLSDLPFVVGVFTARSADSDMKFPQDQEPLITIRTIVSETGVALGVEIKAVEGCVLTAVSLFPTVDTTPHFVLIDGTVPTERRRVCVQLLLETSVAWQIENRDTFLRELYKPRQKEETPAGTILFRGEAHGQAVAISVDGRLIGVTVPLATLRQRSYDLRPDQYVQPREEVRLVESPALLLGTIRHNQGTLLQHIDSLLGRLELASIAGQRLPSSLFAENGKPVEPFGNLSLQQQVVWNRVCKQVKKVSDDEGTYETAVLFTPAEMEGNQALEVSDATRSTLDLLERMGVIIPVTVADPSTGEPVTFYRLATERDRWPFDVEKPDSEGESP